ncbi:MULTISPECIES: hypothetical protein [Streptomyces]|uniref:Uncharacterized protein n=2 Tax=Streptomyces TaxID=1883 RepID=A0A2U9NZ37_STRAS|nr:hypothetical protein [Streptomyces actuosus]AWT42609.1 hypothetical protein DMT42_09970 [Streptomyces actuosus]MBM4819823.1 hypothetical protein [Streptomyces actuosus]
MSVLDHIPALKGNGRRRAVDEVERLRRDLTLALSHLHAAGDELAFVKQERDEARAKRAEAEEIVVKQQADIDELTEERDELAEELAALKRRFAALLAVEANTHRIDVPPMVRDTSAIEDQATEPIDVRPLQEAAALGLLGPVTDPGRIR